MTTDLITVKQVTKTYGSKNKEIAALKIYPFLSRKGQRLALLEKVVQEKQHLKAHSWDREPNVW